MHEGGIVGSETKLKSSTDVGKKESAGSQEGLAISEKCGKQECARANAVHHGGVIRDLLAQVQKEMPPSTTPFVIRE
jgi:hypothetical protein